MIDDTFGSPSATSVSETTVPAAASATFRRLTWIAVLLIAGFGLSLRFTPSGAFQKPGFDESLYRDYVLMVDRFGVSAYPAFCEFYLEDQKSPGSITKLPPTRFLYVFAGWVGKRIAFGGAPPVPNVMAPGSLQNDPALVSLHWVSSIFSSLTMLLVGAAAWRMFGVRVGLVSLVLAAASPLLIHLAQHGFIDVFFAFWATLSLWLLWENLQRPNHAGWLWAYGASLGAMVLTKENSFFAYLALTALVAVNPWAKFGVVTRRLLLVSILGPLAGLCLLITLAGGVGQFIDIYRTLVVKAQNHPFSVATGDGPWYRYLIELLTLTPIVFCLAMTGLLTLPREKRGYLFLLGFVVFSYAIMCNVRYGMNLRYASIWELPLMVYAGAGVLRLAALFGRREMVAATILVTALAVYNLRQYTIFFVDRAIYELVPEGMLRAVNVVKTIKEGPGK